MDYVLQYVLVNPVQFITAAAMIYYFYKGKFWHSFMAMFFGVFVYGAYLQVGATEFISGIVIGIAANELFRFVREKIENERKS